MKQSAWKTSCHLIGIQPPAPSKYSNEFTRIESPMRIRQWLPSRRLSLRVILRHLQIRLLPKSESLDMSAQRLKLFFRHRFGIG
ncbi:hypothetical protein, partial [Escherichia coli]|uniref:hypothetical protein n=1 Tax=Escherichia coli TaxID=562 RepID=UPI0028E02F15